MKMEEQVVLMKQQGETPTFYIGDKDDDGNDKVHATTIKEANYQKVTIKSVVEQQQHLNPGQKEKLRSALWGNDVLFDGRLKKYVGKKIRLDIHKNSHPIHCKTFPVPQTQVDLFKKECERLVKEVVLEPVGAMEHALTLISLFPSFRWVSDFRKLNQMLRRRVYPLPRIQDVLHRQPGYIFLTKIDLSMRHYTFELDEANKNLRVIATPFGKVCYKRLPIGVSQAPDPCQEIMESIFWDMADVEVFLDDISIFTNCYVRVIKEALHSLQQNHVTVDPLKCEWAVATRYRLARLLFSARKDSIHGLKRFRQYNNLNLRKILNSCTSKNSVPPSLTSMVSKTTLPTFLVDCQSWKGTLLQDRMVRRKNISMCQKRMRRNPCL